MQPSREPGEITKLLGSARRREPDSLDRLLEAVYPSLRSIAGNLMRGERQDHTLEPTALAHEAIIRMFLRHEANYRDRSDLMAAAGREMRRLLVDHARRRLAARRGGGTAQTELPDLEGASASDLETWVLLDNLLDELRAFDLRAAEVVELRFFCGLSRDEVAARLGITVRTVQRDWDAARAWLLSAVGPPACARGSETQNEPRPARSGSET